LGSPNGKKKKFKEKKGPVNGVEPGIKQTKTMINIDTQDKLKQPQTNFFSFSEEMEIKLHQMTHSHGMKSLMIPRDNAEFSSVFLHLSSKAQYLFRLIENWKYLECYPSQTLLAKMIGTTREWVNKLLKILSNLKIIVKQYRHRQTCTYFIPKKFKGLSWERIKFLILNPREFTPQFTPSIITSKYSSILSKKPGMEKRAKSRKKTWNKAQAPPWLCNFPVFEEKNPFLASLFRQDPRRWWNMAAFPENNFQRVVDEMRILIETKKNLDRPWNWFMARLLKLTPKSQQNWSLAGKLKKNKQLV